MLMSALGHSRRFDALPSTPGPPRAFDAIARTLPLGSVGYKAEPDANGERYVGSALAMRGPGESYSDVFLRLVEADGSWS
jgi:hypothetical protein